jgi:hypothetical protein
VPTTYPCRVVDSSIVWEVGDAFTIVATPQAVELHGDLATTSVAVLVQLLHVADRVHRDLRRGVGIAAVVCRLV